MTKTYLSALVGNSHRLAGSLVLAVLEVGQELILEPEPENPHDPEAIKVCVDMTGSPYVKDPNAEGPIIHLGYIPKSGGRFDSTGFGNRQVLHIMQGGPNWKATLTFDPHTNPLVQIQVE